MIKFIFFDWGDTLGIKKARSTHKLWKVSKNKDNLKSIYLKSGVEGLLEYLKQKGYILGIITNSKFNSEENVNFLKTLGILHYFSTVVSSKDVCKKGCKKFFEIAMHNVNALPENSVYIGNNYKKDILGSQNVGMYSIYVNKKSNSKLNYNRILKVDDINELKNIF